MKLLLILGLIHVVLWVVLQEKSAQPKNEMNMSESLVTHPNTQSPVPQCHDQPPLDMKPTVCTTIITKSLPVDFKSCPSSAQPSKSKIFMGEAIANKNNSSAGRVTENFQQQQQQQQQQHHFGCYLESLTQENAGQVETHANIVHSGVNARFHTAQHTVQAYNISNYAQAFLFWITHLGARKISIGVDQEIHSWEDGKDDGDPRIVVLEARAIVDHPNSDVLFETHFVFVGRIMANKIQDMSLYEVVPTMRHSRIRMGSAHCTTKK